MGDVVFHTALLNPCRQGSLRTSVTVDGVRNVVSSKANEGSEVGRCPTVKRSTALGVLGREIVRRVAGFNPR
jgi:hypothetical protein